MGVMVSLSSCHKDDDVVAPEPTPQPAKPTTYTIMLYGCGGGNLDEALDYNLSQLDTHGKTDRVNFTGLIKFSDPRQGDVATEGTRLYTLTDEGLKNEKVGEANFRMDNPAHLTQFIKDTKEKMPADKYILIFWNHGQEFGASDKLPENQDYTEKDKTRSILFDDNVGGESMSAYEVEKGIKDAGQKMDLIYMDLCNTGMAEVYYQLKDCAKYMMAAAAPTPGIGGNYAELVEDLQDNDSLEDAIKEYVPNCVKNWKSSSDGDMQTDLECYDLSYMDEFVGYLKNAMGEYGKLMKQVEESQKENYDKEYDGWVLDPGYGQISGNTDLLFNFMGGVGYSIDVCSAFTLIANYNLDGAMSHYATMMQRVLGKMTVAQAANNLPSGMDAVSMGMMWPTNSFLEYKDNQKLSIADNLKYAALYKATGWNDILTNTVFHKTQRATSPLGNVVYLDGNVACDFKYSWQYELIVDMSELDEAEQAKVQKSINECTRELNKIVKENPFALCLGKYAVDEAQSYLSDNTRFIEDLMECDVETFKIKVYTTDSVDPADPFKDKCPAEVEKEFEI